MKKFLSWVGIHIHEYGEWRKAGAGVASNLLGQRRSFYVLERECSKCGHIKTKTKLI
jgi:hypothetical protein